MTEIENKRMEKDILGKENVILVFKVKSLSEKNKELLQ